MLLYGDQYNVLSGVFFAFHTNSTEKILCVSHPAKKMDTMSKFYSYNKYSSWTKQNYIILCLYLNLNNSILSQHDMIQILNDVTKEDIKNVIKFKESIINYRREAHKDIQYLNDSFGGDMKYQGILQEYRKGNINWFTLWFYTSIKLDKEKLLKSRIHKKLLNKIRVLTLYINFKEETFKEIINTTEENLLG